MHGKLPSGFEAPCSAEFSSELVLVNGCPMRCPSGRLAFLGLSDSRKGPLSHQNPPSLEVDNDIRQDIVSLLTNGQLDITGQNIKYVTYAAFKNNLVHLLLHCENILLGQLSPSTCLKQWVFAADHGCERLKAYAFALVLEHFVEIVKTESWCHLDKHRVRELVFNPRLSHISSEVLCHSIVFWGQYDRGLRHQDVLELLGARCQRVDQGFVFDKNPHMQMQGRLVHDFSAFFVGLTDTHERLGVIELRIVDGQLRERDIEITVPNGIDKDSSFSSCHERKYLIASSKKQAWRFGGNSNNWKKAGPKLPNSRKHHTVFRCGEGIFLLGGYCMEESVNRPTRRVFVLPNKDKWKNCFHGNKMELSSGVHSCKCVAVGSEVLVFGVTVDEEGNRKPSLQIFDPSDSDRNESLPAPPVRGDVSCVVPSENKTVHVLSSKGDVLEFHPQTRRFDELPSLPTPRAHFGAFVHCGFLYVFGGLQKNSQCSAAENLRLDLHNKASTWTQCGRFSRSIKILS